MCRNVLSSGYRSLAVPFVLFLSVVTADRVLAQESAHPMDPLTWAEHWVLLEALRDAGHYDGDTRLAVVTLEEPSKAQVWAWQPGELLPRRARAVVRRDRRTWEAVVDVGVGRVVSWAEVPGAQANWLHEEFMAGIDAVKRHPDFLAAMQRRGIMDLTFIDCHGVPPGYFGLADEEGRRVSYVQCADARRLRNLWPQQIEGLTVVVDINDGTVIRVVDEGAVPIPGTRADYDVAAVGPLRDRTHPMEVTQPLGPGFRLEGHQITWDSWSLHVRPDQRVGPIISTVRFRDGDRDRPILYQGSLSEIFVPYMDPAFSWYRRNFLDAGEFVAGGLLKPLAPGIDCPSNAVYIPQTIIRDNGRPRVVEGVICIFERLSGDMIWRHGAETVEGRPKRDLVVRAVAVLGNYDYVFDWMFQQDGTIRVAVGATGITEVKIVRDRNTLLAAANGNGASGRKPADAYGRFVADNIVAVNHDHYFSYRIDLDVDGPTNSFVRDRLQTMELPADHPRRSVWVVNPEVARREHDAMLSMDMHRPALWRVINNQTRNHVGYNTSYQLMPGMPIHTLLTADDYPRRRAGFIDHHLWVTPHQPAELYAAGMYPTLSRPGEGLPQWTRANRGIENTDIVLWYTFGMHHVARAEDWPVMPVAWHAFELRPFDFFDGNPAMAAPLRP
jgi:primary-amine oxidase